VSLSGRGAMAMHVPHTRGDEPAVDAVASACALMFPTHVGMNRMWRRSASLHGSMFPTHVGMNR